MLRRFADARLRAHLDKAHENREKLRTLARHLAIRVKELRRALETQAAITEQWKSIARQAQEQLAAERARTQETQSGAYLIWSHHHDAWWGPNAQGYRGNVADAGRYATRDAAVNRYKGRGCCCCVVPEVAVPAPLPGQVDSASLVKLIAVATEAEVAAGRVNKHAETARTQETQP